MKGYVVERDGIKLVERTPNELRFVKLQEAIALLVVAVLCVVIGTWLIGELSPKNTHLASEMKHDAQRSGVRWLSILAGSVVGAYKLHNVIDLIIAAIR